MDPIESLHSNPTNPEQPRDGLAMWDAEAQDDARVGLAEVRPDQNDRLLIPFTTSMVRATLHYLNFASLRRFVTCNTLSGKFMPFD
jgi:hypothetical protein